MGEDTHDAHTKQKLEELVSVLGEVLKDLPRPCTEKDVRKAYHSLVKKNINSVLDEIIPDSPILYNFLRHHCKSICEVITNDGDVRIYRIVTIDLESNDADKKKAKKKPNNAPKLNYPRIPLGIVKKNATSNCQWVKKAKDPKVSACQTFISSPTEKEEGDDEITANYIYDRTKKTSIFDFHFPDIDRSCAAPVKFEDPAVFPKLSDESETVVEKKWWVDKEALTKTQNEAKIEKTPKPAEAAVALENHEHQEIDAIHAESLSNTKKPDDAPQMARVKDMFLKFYPEIVVDASLECATKMLKISEINCIKINVFYSRYQFYFEEISTSHSYFMHCMKEFYELAGNDLKVQKEEHFMQGMLVAIKAGEWWLRAKILSVDPSNQDQVKCLFVDCGIECNVNKSNIEYLIKAFICHPINCFKGSSKINPGDLTGTNEAMNRRAFDAVAGKKLMIRINKYDPVKNVYEIETA